MNPMQLIGMLRGSGNPQAMVMNMLRQNAGENPVLNNALNMAEKGDMKGVEKLARNLCKERNIDADSALGQIKNMVGVR